MLHFRPTSPPTGRFAVSVSRWAGGWDLYIEGDGLSGGGVTQVTHLADADAQVRNYLGSVLGADFADAVIDIELPDEAQRVSVR